MAIRITSAVRTTMVDVLVDAIDAGGAGGTIKLYTGSQPATADTAASGTLLATFTLDFPAYGAGAAGVATMDTTPILSATAVTNGTAGWARVATSAGVTVYDGNVGTAASNDFTINSTAVTTGQAIRLSVGTMTVPV